MCRRSTSAASSRSPSGERLDRRLPGVAERERAVARQDDRALHHVLELAHVAGPVVAARSDAHHLGGNRVDRLAAARARRRSTRCRTSSGMSLAPLAQRRHRDRKHVEAVVEIAAEPALRAPPRRGRGWSRRSPARRRRPSRGLPSRSTCPSCRTRSSFGCSSSGSSPISSRKIVPRCASSKRPIWVRMRAGERAALAAEQLALDQRRRQRGAVDDDERPVAPRAAAGESRARAAPCRCRSRRRAAPWRRSSATWSTRNMT